MTAVVTAKGGFDPAYPWRSAGASGKQAGSDYYLVAGEPPGRWAGRGAEALGLSGQISEAERADYDAVYAQTDPRTGERLGRRQADYSASYQATLDRLLAAEPHATAERVAELEWAAHKQTRQAQAVHRCDRELVKVPVGVPRVAAGERRAGPSGGRRGGRGVAGTGRSRTTPRSCSTPTRRCSSTPSSGRDSPGPATTARRSTAPRPGRWARAGVVISSWLQGTSRDGDPQDHTPQPVGAHGAHRRRRALARARHGRAAARSCPRCRQSRSRMPSPR